MGADVRQATITIGGMLDVAGRKRLAEAVAEDGARIEYGPRLNQAQALGAIESAANKSVSLDLNDDLAFEGRFDAIEETCIAMGLRFCRESGATDDDEAEIVVFDGTTRHETTANENGDIMLKLDAVKGAIADGSLAALLAQYAPFEAEIPPVTFWEVF